LASQSIPGVFNRVTAHYDAWPILVRRPKAARTVTVYARRAKSRRRLLTPKYLGSEISPEFPTLIRRHLLVPLA